MRFQLSLRSPRAIASGLGAGLTIAVLFWIWLGTAPQIGEDKEVTKAVDALFTAITSRNHRWLERCEQQLHALRDDDRLPRRASEYLDGIIRTAREGNWRKAAKELFGFIKSQRPPNVSGPSA